MPTRTAGRFGYQPALDGVRAVAVTLVLLFHGGVSWMPGGYVGVSVFFTLSGFLITSLLLQEHDDHGRIAVGAFYARRIKRLWPASLACVGGVVVAARLGAFDGVPHLRADLWGAIGQVLNWVKLSQGSSYDDLVAATVGRIGPLDHYWSLAIEEQFYWLWPLCMLLLLPRLVERRARLLALCGLAAAAVVLPFPIHRWFGPDAVYWATPARLGEILVGAALAVIVRTIRPQRWWAGLAPPALAVVVWAATTWPAGSGPAYEGWLGVFALASAGLILGLQVDSPLRTALAWQPLVGLGLVSYGVYLYHWPVFALVDGGGRMGEGALLGLRVAITLALAAVSYIALERPVRRGTLPVRSVARSALATGVAAAALVVVVPQPATFEQAASAEELQQAAITPSGSVAPLVGRAAVGDAALPLARPLRVLVVGDSTAMSLGDGLVPWANDHPNVAQVSLAATPGCGLLRSGQVPGPDGEMFQEECDEVLARLPEEVTRLQPDVVVVMVTMRDVEDREWSADEGPLSPRDLRFVERLQADYLAFAREVQARGVPRVAWLLAPRPLVPWQGEAIKMADPVRYERHWSVIRAVAEELPGVVEPLDLARWMEVELGAGEDAELRPDGLHFSPESAYEVADRFLMPELLRLALVSPSE